MAIGMVVSYCYSDHDLGGGIYLPLTCFLLHRGMISLKYASMSKSEYSKNMNCSVQALLDEYTEQLQLITGISDAITDVVQFEIAAAAARTGLLLNQLKYHISVEVEKRNCINNQIPNWKNFTKVHNCMSEHMSSRDDFTVSVSGCCYCLLTKAYVKAGTDNNVQIGCFVIVVIQCLIPFLLKDQQIYKSNVAIMFYITSTFINLMYYTLILRFLTATMFHCIRKSIVAKNLGSMIRVFDTCFTTNLMTCREEGNAIVTSIDKKDPPDILKTNSRFSDHLLGGLDLGELNYQLNSLHHKRRKNTTTDAAGRVSNSRTPSLAGVANPLRYSDNLPRASSESVLGSSDDLENRMSGNANTRHIQREGVTIPRVSFHCSQNVYAWLNTRLMMQNYGLRFRFRVDSYVGFITLIVAANMIIVVILFLLKRHVPPVYFHQTALLVLVMGAFIILYIRQGSIVNANYEAHGYVSILVCISVCR